MKTFNTYISSVFLYNSELWGMSETDKKSIDAFHRRMLRKTLGIHWPRKVSNEKLYRITKAEPWSTVITRRRFTFLGHVLRLHPDTPIKQSLQEVFKPSRKKRGRPPTTWASTIKQDLAKINIQIKLDDPTTIKTLVTIASDRNNWKILKKMLMQ